MRIRQGCVERNRPIILILALLAFVGFAAADSGRISAQTPERYIVVLNEGVDLPSVASDHAVTPKFVYSHALNGFSAVVPPGRLNGLQRDPRVAYVEADQPVELFAQEVPTGVLRIFADDNPNIHIDGVDDWRVDVDVAVIDTGIDLDHPDLNVVASTDCTGNPFNTSCGSGGDDGNDHGTHVAGTIAALDNGIGVVGVAPGARLWAVKVLKDNGNGWMSNVIGGVDYVTQHAGEIEVANMSLGGGDSQSLCDAIGNSFSAGVAYAVAAGNDDDDAANHSPANCPGVTTVSALVDYDGKPGELASPTCRNYGDDDHSATFSNWGSDIEIAAPGVCILSTVPGGYATFSGTSMASPHVAGAAALLASGSNDPTDESEVQTIYDTLTDNGNFDWTDDSGDGIKEPLLDVSDTAVFAPELIAGSDESGSADTTPPTAPANLAATAGDGKVDLTWDDNTESDLADYNIYRSETSGGPYATIATAVASSAYTDNSANNGTTYYYVVTAVDTSENESEYSNEASATPQASSDGGGDATYTVDLASQSINNGSSWMAEVTITITSSESVSGITVNGAWDTIGGDSCTTDAAGTCTVTTSQHKRVSEVTFTVDTVGGSNDFDGETAITVSKP